jgi:hypothetical protein
MSVFSPYTVYKVAFPFLRPGYLIKVGDKYYMVITARNNRPIVTLTGAQTKFDLDVGQSSPAGLECMAGELKKNRIVHIQYVAIDTANTPTLYWGVEPLLSKDVEVTLSTTMAGLTNPIAVDRWSYDPSMRLLITQTATQNYYFEIMEYEVTPYEGVPDRPYLQIMANGQAILVESPGTEKTLGLLNAARSKMR